MINYERMNDSLRTWKATRRNVVAKGRTRAAAFRNLRDMERTILSLTGKDGNVLIDKLKKVKIVLDNEKSSR